jgi:hypothetical protein
MPTIIDFGAFKITMYFEDHNPPHVHVVAPNAEAQVEIMTGEILAGSMRKANEKVALPWIAANRSELMKRWEEYHS